MDRDYEADGTSGFSRALLSTTETVLGAAGVVIHPLVVSTDHVEPGWHAFAFGWTMIDPGGRYQIDEEGLSVTATIAGSVKSLEEGTSPSSGRVLSNDGHRPALVLSARMHLSDGHRYNPAGSDYDTLRIRCVRLACGKYGGLPIGSKRLGTYGYFGAEM